MPDISLRFHRDMLAIASPIAVVSAPKPGLVPADASDPAFADALAPYAGPASALPDADGIWEELLLTEPETIADALALAALSGTSCIVLPTHGITRARLAHVRLEQCADAIARSAVELARSLRVPHVLAEIGPALLPIDPTSPSSLKANRAQYAEAARVFEGLGVDALFLNDLVDADDVRCALEGVRTETDLPVFASVRVDADGKVLGRPHTLDDVLDAMEEGQADVAGFSTGAGIAQACALARRCADRLDAPLLVQLDVAEVCSQPSYDPARREANPYWHPDMMVQAGIELRAAGAQFVRAQGAATASYGAALAATLQGLDALR